MENIRRDEYWMNRCLELATNGLGRVAPNPLVGSVIIFNDHIIGEGYHQAFGGPHAEINALASVSSVDKKYLKQATLYVNLEPCSHHGKTPPCADRIVKTGVARVVIANLDPNPKVAGKGVKKIFQSGIEVASGVLKEKGNELNRRFFTYHTKKRPYIMLKWAQSQDGFFTKNRNEQHWITGPQSKRLVHKWRTEEQAILVGKNTVAVDNPELTAREWPAHRQPLRIVIDKNLELEETLKIYQKGAKTLILNAHKDDKTPDFDFVQLNFDKPVVPQLLGYLHHINIQSLIVEGGISLLESFIQDGLWDEARVFVGAPFFHSGIPAPTLSVAPVGHQQIGDDRLFIFRNTAR